MTLTDLLYLLSQIPPDVAAVGALIFVAAMLVVEEGS